MPQVPFLREQFSSRQDTFCPSQHTSGQQFPHPVILPLFHIPTRSQESAGTHTAFAMQEMGVAPSCCPKPAQDGFLRSCKLYALDCHTCCHAEHVATCHMPHFPLFFKMIWSINLLLCSIFSSPCTAVNRAGGVRYSMGQTEGQKNLELQQVTVLSAQGQLCTPSSAPAPPTASTPGSP